MITISKTTKKINISTKTFIKFYMLLKIIPFKASIAAYSANPKSLYFIAVDLFLSSARTQIL
jgi:hypothetical protein